MATQVALKMSYNGDIHRARVDLRAFAFADLAQLMGATFRLAPGAFVIQYVDPEGDRVNVSSDADLAEACRVFLGDASPSSSLKFEALTRRQLEFHEQVADPLVASLQQLIDALQTTVDKVKRDSAGIAGDVHAAVLDAKQSIQELPVDHVLHETQESVKAASSGFSSFASGLVGEIKRFIPEKKPAAEAAAPAAAPAAAAAAPVVQEPQPAAVFVPEPEVVVPVAVEAQQAPVETVEVQETAVEVAEPPAAAAAAAAATPAVAFSEDEVKWAEELSVVRNIIPDVDVARVIDMLEKSDGNIQVVMNVLMEES